MTATDELKRCPTDERHVWMADIPLCPYCHCNPEFRAAMAEKQQREAFGTRIPNEGGLGR